MPSLHKDPKKRSPYWYCAYNTRDDAGKLVRHFRSTKTADKKEAVQICNVWAKASALGAKLTPDKARDVIAQGVADVLMASGQSLPSASIRDWCKRWLEIKSLEAEPRTHERYKASLKRFVESLGNKADEDLNSLTVNQVLKYRDHLSKQLAPNSTNLELKILRACLYSAQKQDLVEKNVASKVDTLRERGENKRRGFTLEEVQKVLKQCDRVEGEWRGLILTGLYTGQRLGDVAQMTWQQVDLANEQISFVTQKTGKRLAFRIAKPLADYLTQLPSSDQADAYVFPKAAAMAEKHTGTISTKFYDEILAPAGLAIARPKTKAREDGKGRGAKRQVSELSFHSLRHTFTTWLKSAGASNALAQMIVGHDSEVVSRGYTHLSAGDTADAISKLPDVTKIDPKKIKRRKSVLKP
jgi:integrase